MRGRRSVRAFLPTPVSRATVAEILELAACAPSGTNTQPWHVTVLAGAQRQALCDRAMHAFHHEPDQHGPEYDVYPEEFVEPYLGRRRRNGFELYASIGIVRGDKAAMQRQHARNFTFFDAPVGLIFTVDRRMSRGSWVDYGMFMQNIMLAARARGLDTCPQMAWAMLPGVVTEVLELPAHMMVVCGMALGHADLGAPENRLRAEREPVANFTRFEGFADTLG
ncbi:nitroreductase [Variovorax sp. J22R133]|uniref:nitroreductase n=1 Tax=Variovorax brevis TaxID=3053503 RepID=UPI002577A893|nr:nitroreductase [Variovorax sp. J22R133]MDM0113679.1 nitroreductase [Variovorax sp. J22R133]